MNASTPAATVARTWPVSSYDAPANVAMVARPWRGLHCQVLASVSVRLRAMIGLAFILMTFLLMLFVVFASPLPAEEADLPLLYESGFDSGADDWAPTEKDTWQVKKTAGGNVYSLFKKQASYQPKFRSPFHISLLNDIKVGTFQFDVDVLSTHADYDHRDVCLFFGYQHPDQFYYLHLGKKTDDHANQIFIVNRAARTKISTKTTEGTNWDDKWHHVRIKRDADSGSIEVYFDDMDTPVMTAVDKNFTWGQIGVGSFDDIADFDNVKLRGKKQEAE